MTSKEKQLLLKDLCARLPYGVKVQNKSTYTDDGYITVFNSDLMYLIGVRTVKPYLRSMSSMTEEEASEYNSFSVGEDWISNPFCCVPAFHVLDWLNSHHFDYRGLIEKGLALEAPDEMYKIKQL